MNTTFTTPSRLKEERLMLHLATALATYPDLELEACARRMQSELDESPSALEGPYRNTRSMMRDAKRSADTQRPRIVRPGNPEEYWESAMVGWQPLRTETT